MCISVLQPKNLRKQVIQYFREIEGLSDEACINQFFHLLSKLMAFDIEVFPKCAVDVSINKPVTLSSLLDTINYVSRFMLVV